MFYAIAAELVVIFHFAFIVFAVLGALLALKWRRVIYFHLPAMGWAALVMFNGWICPLTPLEKYLRGLAGQAAYEGDFIAQYLLPIIYPAGLTREMQIGFGVLVILINAGTYVFLYWKKQKANA